MMGIIHVLIIVTAVAGGNHVVIHEFGSKQACENAINVAQLNGTFRKAFCVPKNILQ